MKKYYYPQNKLYIILLFLFMILNITTTLAQSDQNTVSFKFNWTSGDLIELVAKSALPGIYKIKVSDYPEKPGKETYYVYSEKLSVRSKLDFYSEDSLRLILFSGDDVRANRFFAKDSIKMKFRRPNKIYIDKNTSQPLEYYKSYFVIAMKNDSLYKMRVVYQLDNYTDTTYESYLRIIRYPYEDTIYTYLENEQGIILSAFDKKRDSLYDKSGKKKFPDVSSLESVMITILSDSNKYFPAKKQFTSIDGKKPDSANVIEVWPTLPQGSKFVLDLNSSDRISHETDWIEINASSNGSSNYIDLYGLKLIRNGGKVKIKYHKKGSPDKTLETTGIVLERYLLSVETGNVYNVNVEGKYVGNFEYSLLGTSIFGSLDKITLPFKKGLKINIKGIWDGAAKLGYSYMRLPASYDTSSKKEAKIGNIVEGKVQIGFSPGEEEWEPSKFSFVGNIFMKTGNLNQTKDLNVHVGYGIGVRLSVPSFNEKRPAEEFSRSSGRLIMYTAYDPFWELGNRFRFVSDFRIDILRFASDKVTISLNGKIDLPIGNLGPSDIRFTIMSSIPTTVIKNLFSTSN